MKTEEAVPLLRINDADDVSDQNLDDEESPETRSSIHAFHEAMK